MAAPEETYPLPSPVTPFAEGRQFASLSRDTLRKTYGHDPDLLKLALHRLRRAHRGNLTHDLFSEPVPYQDRFREPLEAGDVISFLREFTERIDVSRHTALWDTRQSIFTVRLGSTGPTNDTLTDSYLQIRYREGMHPDEAAQPAWVHYKEVTKLADDKEEAELRGIVFGTIQKFDPLQPPPMKQHPDDPEIRENLQLPTMQVLIQTPHTGISSMPANVLKLSEYNAPATSSPALSAKLLLIEPVTREGEELRALLTHLTTAERLLAPPPYPQG